MYVATETGQFRQWVQTHPWVVRVIGIETLLLTIALLGGFVLSNAFGSLIYGMAISLFVLTGVGALLAWIAKSFITPRLSM
jgi:hypothetical protein